MLIYVRTVEGQRYELNVEYSDTIANIKSRLSSLLDLTENHMRLIYSGKQVEDGRTLSDYGIGEHATIDLIPRSRGLVSRHSTIPTESILPDREAGKATIQAWKVKAEQGQFDEDICIVNPQAHYTELSFLEIDVVKASEFHSSDAYGNAFGATLRDLDLRPATLPLVPQWMWEIILNPEPADDLGGLGQLAKESLNSLWRSYLILCRVLASFDVLSQTGFCTSYYSILLEQPDKNIAEIVKIPRETLDDIKTGIETATVQICDGDDQPEVFHAHLCDCVEETCGQLLDLLRLPRIQSRRSTASILAVCRMLSLVADLGLVSYVGSHATRFDLEFLHKEVSEITIHDGNSSALYFDCRLRRLACLNEFLDEERVWVFQCGLMGPKSVPRKDDSGTGLFVLTHIEEFADIWGPVWSIPEVRGPPDLIQQHNVSKGVICRVDEAQIPKGNAIRCHWYDWASFRRRRVNPLMAMARPLYLEKDDLLLIGTRFRINHDCKYTPDHFEEDYGHGMGVLGAERSVWEQELDSRSGSFSVTKFIGVSVSGTQKRRPHTSLKQSILGKWKTKPETANPVILNQYLGIEISHCTGNATRVRLKDLLLMPSVRSMLDLQFPGWSGLWWGRLFLRALQSEDPEAVFDVWVNHKSKRPEMAAIVCWVLENLEMTGKREDGIVAAFFNNRSEYSVTFDHGCNDWSNLLRDSHLMATYAIVNNICVECHTPDHSTATHNGESAYTVLETRLGLNLLAGETFEPQNLVKVQPHGQIFKTLEMVDHKTLLMMPGTGASAAGAYLMSSLPGKPVTSGVEIRDVAARGGQQYRIFLRSSNKSYGGMKALRKRAQSIEGKPALPQSPARILGAGRLGRPSSAETRFDSSKRPQIPDANLLLQVPVNIIREPMSIEEARNRSCLKDIATKPSAVPGRSLSADASSRTLHFDNSGTREVYAHSDNSIPPSLVEDIGNYQIDVETNSRSHGLLYDLDNYRLDDDLWDAAGPSTARPAAPPIMRNPCQTDTPALNVPDTINKTVPDENNLVEHARLTNQVSPDVTERPVLSGTGSQQTLAQERVGKISRFFQKFRKQDRQTE